MKITIGKKEEAERLYRIDEMWSNGGSYRGEVDQFGNKVTYSHLFVGIGLNEVLEIAEGGVIHCIHRDVQPNRYKGWLFRRTNESITISFEE